MVCRSDVQCQCLLPFLADTVFAETMTEDFTQEPEDRELFRQIKQGSEEAFREVYGKYHRILYAVALKMLKDRSAAENAVQYVFVKLWVERQDMTVMLSLRNYLYTMTATTSSITCAAAIPSWCTVTAWHSSSPRLRTRSTLRSSARICRRYSTR